MTLPVNNIILRTVSNPPYSTKNAELTWSEEDINFIILADNIKALQTPGTAGFSAYDNGITYSNSPDTFVSYNNNIWKYINAIPQSGIVPGTDPTTWQLTSLGEFSHQQNTDQYLDFGGANQVSAADLYNLLTNPSGDFLIEGTNTLTEDLIFDLVSSFVLKIKNGPLVLNASSPIQNESNPNQKIIVGASGFNIGADSNIDIASGGNTTIDSVGTTTLRQQNGDLYSASTVGPDILFSTATGTASYYFNGSTNDYTAVLVNDSTLSLIFGNLVSGVGKKILLDTTNISFLGDSDAVKLTIGESSITSAVSLILNADPISSLGAATKSYVDNLVTGITWKQSVVAATTANITLSGAQTIDGISVIAGDRVLVKNQSTATQNGLYVCASGSWTRSTDADTGAELASATVLVEGGTVNASTQWNCSNNSITIGSTNITFVQIAGAGVYTNGTGISLIGNVFSIDSTVVTLTGSQALSNKTGNISQWTNDSAYLTSSTGVTTVNGSSGAISNVALTTGTLAQFAATTSAQLAGVISDETGSGALMFATNPTITSGFIISGNTTASAWGTSGIVHRQSSITLTDTSSTGTVATPVYGDYIGVKTFTTSNTVTYTNLYGTYYDLPVTSGTLTATNLYTIGINGSMQIQSGRIKFTGSNCTAGTMDSNAFSIRSTDINRTTWSTTGTQSHTHTILTTGTTPSYQWTQPANSGGSAGIFLITAGATTSQTTATEVTDIDFNLSAIMKSVDGTIPLNRSFRIRGRTITPQTTALTVTDAVNLNVESLTPGSGTTFTRNWNTRFVGSGMVGIGGKLYIGDVNVQTAATALMHLAAGLSTPGGGPIKLTLGTNLATPEIGTIEYNGTNLFFTRTGTTRENVLVGNDGGSAPSTSVLAAFTNYYGTGGTVALSTPNSWASVVISGTTYKIPLYI